MGVVQGGLMIGGPGLPALDSIAEVPGLHRIPADSALFVGRADELRRLAEAVAEGSGRVVVVAVHGLGGVGKSTLAVHFCRVHSDRYAMVWWITADSVAAINTGLAELTTALNPQTADLPLEQRTDLAVRWLATHDGWLLVLDNLTDPGDVAGLLERVRTGTILITSRQGTGWRDVNTISLDVLPPEEATELLTRIVRAEWPEADLTDADRLCEELGWLPLAVEQAGAYIAQTRIIPTTYLDLLARFPARMFTATAEGGDSQRTMARVWHLTLDRLTDTPLAGEVLRQLAWYAPDAIPRSLVTSGIEAPEPDVVHALGRLAAYSMITLDADAISVHRLVQAVARTPDPADPHRQPADITRARDTTIVALTGCLAKASYRLPVDWPIFQTVLSHVQALLDHTAADSDTEPLCDLTNRIGLYLDDQGNTTTAIVLCTHATHSRERLLGPDHLDTLSSRNNLAAAYQSVLADRLRVLGSDHPDTLYSRNNLASAYYSAGDVGRAIPLYESVLADARRVLGPDHPLAATVRSNLEAARKDLD